jgi:transposase-like protein
MEDAVWAQMMRQISTRKYSELVQQFAETYGVKKSAISEHFIACSRQKLQELLQRRLEKLQLCAMFLDSTVFKAEHLVAAVGVSTSGHKAILGLWQGATENAEVVRALLADLQERGVDFNVPRLYVLDGSKALRKAVEQVAGSAGVFQRCQVHKTRNVLAHLPDGYNHSVRARMQAAYACTDYSEARSALCRLHDELERRNPSAARSLAEGMEETLTVHRLRMQYILRRTLATTNPIESAFSIVETICSNVKQWSGGDQRLRWVASALLYAESRFRRLQGSGQIPFMVKELELMTLKQGFKTRAVGAA